MVTPQTTQVPSGAGRLRVSIRYKLLLVIAALLMGAIGAYVYLASTLFTRDKLAYVFDAHAAQVDTVAEQTRANLVVLTQILALFTRDATAASSDSVRAGAAAEMFRVDPELVHVDLYRRRGADYERVGSWVNDLQLDPLGLSRRDLDGLRRSDPLPFEAIAARPGEPFIRNSSLPPDAGLLTVAVAFASGQELWVTASEFRHERLLRTFGGSKLHDTYLLDERGVVLAHSDAQKVIGRLDLARHPLVKAGMDGQVERGVREFKTEDGVRMLGGYGRVEAGRLIVISQLTRYQALRAGGELIRRSIYFAIAVLLCAILVTIFLSRLVTSPIQSLRAATEVVAQGRFVFDVDQHRQDEIGDLARSFVHMSTALRDAQAQLVRSEKLAAFGQLGAGITHELKNPLTGIVGFAQIAQRKLEQKEKLTELLKLIEQEGLRCKDILVNFLKFARQQSGHDTVRIDANDLVKSSAKIVSHQLAIHNVKLEVELEDGLPEIQVNGGEIQQVLLNLAINAQQAMPEGGQVRFITRRAANNGVEIAVADNGPGIPEAIREKIFDPFFTTKAPGEGTGLGLAISFGIVRDHGGALKVETEVGKGTTFIIQLPPAPAVPMTVPEQDERRAAHA